MPQKVRYLTWPYRHRIVCMHMKFVSVSQLKPCTIGLYSSNNTAVSNLLSHIDVEVAFENNKHVTTTRYQDKGRKQTIQPTPTKTLFKGRTTLGVIQTHDTLLSRWDLYQLGYQGNSAANLQHNTKANIKPLCYGKVYFCYM